LWVSRRRQNIGPIGVCILQAVSSVHALSATEAQRFLFPVHLWNSLSIARHALLPSSPSSADDVLNHITEIALLRRFLTSLVCNVLCPFIDVVIFNQSINLFAK